MKYQSFSFCSIIMNAILGFVPLMITRAIAKMFAELFLDSCICVFIGMTVVCSVISIILSVY